MMATYKIQLCLLFLIPAIQAKTSTTNAPDPCNEAPSVGECRAALPRWFFDKASADCKEFIWGGCPDSTNNFATKAVCIRHCRSEVCSLSPDVGPCRADIPMWFYNHDSRMCKPFAFGGCEGNDNKFSTRLECETACAGSNLPCDLGTAFHSVGAKAVHSNYRDKEWFTYKCNSRCRDACLADHPWGYCLSFSVRKRWWGGCNCYLYDRFLSQHEFDHDTKGVTKNRVCSE